MRKLWESKRCQVRDLVAAVSYDADFRGEGVAFKGVCLEFIGFRDLGFSGSGILGLGFRGVTRSAGCRMGSQHSLVFPFGGRDG